MTEKDFEKGGSFLQNGQKMRNRRSERANGTIQSIEIEILGGLCSQGLARVTQVAVTTLPALALERCTQLEKLLDCLKEPKGKSD